MGRGGGPDSCAEMAQIVAHNFILSANPSLSIWSETLIWRALRSDGGGVIPASLLCEGFLGGGFFCFFFSLSEHPVVPIESHNFGASAVQSMLPPRIERLI